MNHPNTDWLAYIYKNQGKLSDEDFKLFSDFCKALGLTSVEVSADHVKAVTEATVAEFKHGIDLYVKQHQEWLNQFAEMFNKEGKDNELKS
jgi:hypothetical protein